MAVLGRRKADKTRNPKSLKTDVPRLATNHNTTNGHNGKKTIAKVSEAYHTKWEQSTPHRHHSLLDTICDSHQELKYDLKQ